MKRYLFFIVVALFSTIGFGSVSFAADSETGAGLSAVVQQTGTTDDGRAISADVVANEPVSKAISGSKERKTYVGHKVSLDFEETGIRNVFRLLSEVSGVNIVAGEEIKGVITVHIKSVPWDQALETILETNSLGQKRTGNVISVFPLEKIKKAEEERQKTDIAQGRKTQIAIEAKIVETTTTYSRLFGVQWGGGAKIGSSYVGGGGSVVPSDLAASSSHLGVLTETIGSSTLGTGYLVNLANNYSSSSPTIGLAIGGSKAMLEAQISALEGTGDVKVISSPKVTTLDNVKAYIKQGTAIPIITRATTTEPAKVEYKDAVLQLTVTPTILPDGRLSLNVMATNDNPDYATQKAAGLDNPPINKSEMQSTVVVKDGQTIVVGGIRKVTESNGGSSVPGLGKLPIIGWLFKSEDISKESKEILIFMTPKIVEDSPAQTLKP